MINCGKCGTPMEVQSGQKYHYKECGLTNVYLVNVDVYKCPNCGCTEVAIPRIKILHATLSRAIALKPIALSGAEIRFLRKQLRMKAKDFAEYLLVDASTLSRWENEEQEPGRQADNLIRYVFFSLLEELEGRVERNIAKQIAATKHSDCSHSEVCINAHNPAVYSYC